MFHNHINKKMYYHLVLFPISIQETQIINKKRTTHDLLEKNCIIIVFKIL